MAFGGMLTKAFESVKLKKREYDPEAIDIDDLTLPFIFKSYDEQIIKLEIKTELKSYKSLGYRFKKDFDLDKNEYHAFQIGILLKAIKLNIDLKIPKNSDYFQESLLKLDNQTVVGIVAEIIKKYMDKVPSAKGEIMLKKDLLFSPREMSFLLYYLSFYLTLDKSKKD